MSGSRGTTYKSATSTMVSSIPEGGSLACKQCGALVCSLQSLVSSSYRGFAGKAALTTEATNVRYDRPSIQLMTSGAYTIQEIVCLGCSAYLGWKMIHAHERTERWKEGKHILELEFIKELLPPPVQRGSLPEIEIARRKRIRRTASIWGSRDTNFSLPFAPRMPEFTSPTWSQLVESC